MNPKRPSQLPHPDPQPGETPLEVTQLDQLLLEDSLIPSSGFAASVMDAVTAAQAVPAPIPFPWKLALPGLAAFALVLAAALIAFIRLHLYIRQATAGLSHSPSFDLTALVNSPLAAQSAQALAALAGAFLCLLLTRYLALGRA